MKIIVIADDLTGAAEIAGAALRFGLTSEVQLGRLVDSDADVVVVDADSRSSSAETAFAKVHELTEQAVAMRPDVLFKKVDSLLRGPVLAEITAMRIAGGFDRCLLLCGNPRKRRTVIGGKVYVDGVPLHDTGFAVDPEHPCSTNDVVQLLTQHGMEIGSATSETDSLHVIDPGDEPVAFISIGNLATPEDLEHHSRRWFAQRETTLAAGGAEFFEAVLRMSVGSEPAEPKAEFHAETGDTGQLVGKVGIPLLLQLLDVAFGDKFIEDFVKLLFGQLFRAALELHLAVDPVTRLVVGRQVDVAGALFEHFLKVLVDSSHIKPLQRAPHVATSVPLLERWVF